MTTASYYIHNLDPVILPIWGNFAIRWYGLAYLAGFLTAYLLLDRMARRGEFALRGEALQSTMINIVLGVMIGGRLGYMLFYDFPSFAANPLIFFQLWKGGMASHGGFIGLVLASWYSARKYRISFLHLCDGLALVSPIGLFFGRLANFINGELWGRPTKVPWAVVFPQEAGLAHGDPLYMENAIDLLHQGMLVPRHPSQLYQAALEGVLLFTVMALARKTAWGRANGRLGGLFLCVYAVVRFIAEFFREPEIVHFGWLTQGQLLSMVLLFPVGLVVMVRARPSVPAKPV